MLTAPCADGDCGNRGEGIGAADFESAAGIAGGASGEAAAAEDSVREPSREDEPFRSYLLASVPERGISLFAEENGVSLQAGDKSREFRTRIGIGIRGQDQPVSEYVGDLIADVEFKEGKYELTGFRFENGPSAEESETAEPGVNNETAESPDGRYLAEAYGVNKGITAGGLYPAEGIRLVKRASGKELWSTMGYYSHSFLWSADSRYVAVSYMARIWGGSLVVDARDGSEIALPDLETVRRQTERKTTVHEARPDPEFRSEEWLDDRSLRVSFQWTGADYEAYSGEYVYDVSARKLLEVRWLEEDAPAP